MSLKGLKNPTSITSTLPCLGSRRKTGSVSRPYQRKIAALHERHSAERDSQSPPSTLRAGALLPCTLSLSALSLGNIAWAEDIGEAAAKTSQGFGLNPAEIVLLSAPPLLYGIFSLYRSQVNNQAKLSDFLSIIAATIIIGNIVSAVVFKVRLY
ncbi:g58 [Coccomyxa elongata]